MAWLYGIFLHDPDPAGPQPPLADFRRWTPRPAKAPLSCVGLGQPV